MNIIPKIQRVSEGAGCRVTEWIRMEEKDALMLNPLQLAYMGDTVWEIMVRSRLIRQRKNVRNMHRECVESVNAGAQARFLAVIRDRLTETEFSVYHRGRNAHPHHASPRNQNPADYAEATGFEAVLGFLYLTGQEERMRELEKMIWDIPDAGKETDQPDRE